MKILIAGGAGYLGSVIVPKLIDRGYNIDVVDLCWFGNNLDKDVRVIKKDIFDLEVKDINGYDQVIFLAGLSNDPMAEFSPKDNFIQNTSAPAYLGYISKKAGVKRFIYAGSCSVYGYTVNELYDEESPAVSNYPYGISKLQGEHSVMQMSDNDFSVIAFRQGTINGVSPRMRFDLVVNTMFKSAMQKKEIVVSNPSIWRPILSIRDAANAYIRAVEASSDISGVFNIGSGNYTVGEIGDLVKMTIEDILNIHIHIDIKHIQDFRNYKVSFEKASKILSFKPIYEIRDIVEDLINHRHLFGDFTDPKYFNIEIFKNLKHTSEKV
jgi:nucleoside-diphosphate-sugar epimerase